MADLCGIAYSNSELEVDTQKIRRVALLAGKLEKQKGLGIHQVPITTKPPLTELLRINEVTRSDFKNKEESPYKPEQRLLCFKAIISKHFTDLN